MKTKREYVLFILLIGISIAAPLISYAGVSLIYPDSTISTDVNTNPPISWEQGTDYTLASSLGFAGSYSGTNNDASFTLTFSGLSGGTVTVDKLFNVVATSDVTTYKTKISSALAGTLTTPTTLKLRFWTGATPPTSDGEAITVLDLQSIVDTETVSNLSGDGTIFVQLVCEYQSGSTGSSSVSIQPSSIVLS